jgi:hypothetical protein
MCEGPPPGSIIEFESFSSVKASSRRKTPVAISCRSSGCVRAAASRPTRPPPPHRATHVRRARDTEIRSDSPRPRFAERGFGADGQRRCARDVVAVRTIIDGSLTDLNSSRSMGMCVGVLTTRSRKCTLFVQIARSARGGVLILGFGEARGTIIRLRPQCHAALTTGLE